MYKWMFVLSVAAILGGFVYKKIRGLRNNNPGNIRDTGDNWTGLAVPRNDGAYLRFTDARYGIRALTKILRNYQALHGIKTIRGIINRFAPQVENNTTAYIDDVAARLNISPDATVNVNAIMHDLIAAIIKHENGIQPYSFTEISRGIQLAGREA